MHACDGDIINIDGTGTSRDPYPCRNEKGLDLAGVVLRSYNSRAFISCRTNGFRFFCGMASRGVFFEEITFVNTSIHLFECSLNAVACSFINSSVPTLTLKFDEFFVVRNVQLYGCIFRNNSASSVTIYGNSSVDLNVSNSTFVSNKIRSGGDAILNMSIQNLQANQSSIKVNLTDIRVSQNNCSGKACFRVFAGINGIDLVLVMERVLFENNVADVNILDVHGFSNGYTDFKSSQFRKNTGRAIKIHNGNSIDLKIKSSNFSENGIPSSRIKPETNYDESNGGNFGGGIQVDLTSHERHLGDNVSFVMENTLISENIYFLMLIHINGPAFQQVFHLKNVTFVNNNCYTGYGWSCIHLRALCSNCSFQLEQSTFLNNFGSLGLIRIVSWPPGRSDTKLRTTITNTEFRNNSGGDTCILELLNVYATEIQNCYFINNFGGAVSSYIRSFQGKLTIENTTFYQSAKSQVFYDVGGNSKYLMAFNGFLTVAQSEFVEIRNSSFILDPFSADSKVIVILEGVGKGILDSSVQIASPINTELNMQGLKTYTYHGKATEELVWLSTERCPVGTYSIRRGKQSGYSVKELVNCFPCPVGGNCSSSLAAQPNYWGCPVNNDTITYQLCPEGYCCLPSVDNKCFYDNDSYLHSGCQGSRTGILCGQCRHNFTEGLFTTECVRAKDCTHSWYLVVFLALTSSFALFFIRKPPVFEAVRKHLTWFIPRRKEQNYQTTCSPDSSFRKSVSPNYGFLKVIFYFYQVAGVLAVPSYGVKTLLRNEIVLPVTNLLNFKLYANTNWKICPWPIFTPLLKTVFHLVTVMTIFFWIPVLYLLHSGLNKLHKRRPTFPPAGPYLGAVLETVLLGYSAVTGTIVRLLHCVSIQEVSRWYYDAQYVCKHQWWQQAAIAVIVLNLFPFIFTLYFISVKLYRGKISGKIFLLASILPFPYFLFVLYHYVKKKITKRADYQEIPSTAGSFHDEEHDTNSSTSIRASLPEEEEIPPTAGSFHDEEHDTNSSTSIKASLLEVLCGPFTKPQDDQSNGRIYWESILIGRRFLLIVIGWWQLEHALMRSECLTILCLFYLLHHISQKPFAHSWVNVTEIVSLAALVVIGALNVGLASAGSDVSGINQRYFSILLMSEAVLLGVIPLVSVTLLILCILSQTVRMVIILWKAARARWLIFKRKYNIQLSVQGGDES